MPSIAKPGSLGTDPEPGTPEWDRVRTLHDEAVARLMKLHLWQSRLPIEIREQQEVVRMHAMALGLEADPRPPRQPRVAAPARRRATPARRRATPAHFIHPTPLQMEALAALPGRISEVAERLGVDPVIANSRLTHMVRRGWVEKGQGYGAVWTRTAAAPVVEAEAA